MTAAITTFQDLVETLSRRVRRIQPGEPHAPEHIEEIRDLLRSVKLSREEWEPYVWWRDHYTRTRVGYSTDHFALLLLCWNKGQASPVHDHYGSSCWVAVLHGTLEETRFATPAPGETGPLRVVNRVQARAGEVCYINDGMGLHIMANPTTDDVTVSLHVYAPPYKACHLFDPLTSAPRLVSMLAANAPPKPPTGPPRDSPLDFPQLVAELAKDPNRPEADLVELFDRVVLSEADCALHVHFSDRLFTRSLVHRCSTFSLLVMGWNKGQASPIYTLPEGQTVLLRCIHGGPLSVVPTPLEGGDASASASVTVSIGDKPTVEPKGQRQRLLNNPDGIGVTLALCRPPLADLVGWDDVEKKELVVPVIHVPGAFVP